MLVHLKLKDLSLKLGTLLKEALELLNQKKDFMLLLQLSKVNGMNPEKIKEQRKFDKFTPLHPNEKFNLSNTSDMSMRIMDMVAPIGKGQRGLIVAQPKTGKTIFDFKNC